MVRITIMKRHVHRKVILSIAAAGCLSCIIAFAQTSADSGFKNHVIVKTTETVTRDPDGSVKTIIIEKSSKLNVNQRLVEKKEKDKDGLLQVVSRTQTTEIYDTLGGRTVINEKELSGESGLVVVKITTLKKTHSGSVTTVKSLARSGELEISSRTTVTKDADSGITTTVSETPDEFGNLVTRRTTSQY